MRAVKTGERRKPHGSALLGSSKLLSSVQFYAIIIINWERMGKEKQWEVMDSRVFEAAHLGNINAIQDLIDESADVLEQVTSSSQNSVLHVAARAGQTEFVSEILRIKPEILSYVNSKRDTALHEAAREGHSAIVKVLLDKDQRIVYKEGHINVVNDLIQVASLLALDSEKPDERTSLHAASTRGHADIVKELNKARPGLVGKVDKQGSSPLHSADHTAIWK
ncbi:ankyrin repeat-containing protein At5g02620-like [Cryptomeria japonica]|uniref:ankyrin repeat-containing protein At5g02620-like n=1 Tax=Cryptomeria japonica TaxID=3369 RepID=UPI0027DA284A|nr:ankyrin repeat-containing protein At5g02620-like [Cryptomeria japonica]